jgi:AcrR family transcriptional regulator
MSDSQMSVERPREMILRIATQLFGQRSYPATTMRDIAGEVGMLAGSLYAHIDGKESLLLEIIEEGINEFLDSVGAAGRSELSADEKLRQMIRAHVLIVAAHPQRTLIVFHQWRYLGADNQERIRERRRQYEDLFTDAIDDGIRTGVLRDDLDPRVARLTILGALNWTPEWLSHVSRDGLDDVSLRLADTLLNGVMGRPGSESPA